MERKQQKEQEETDTSSRKTDDKKKKKRKYLNMYCTNLTGKAKMESWMPLLDVTMKLRA